MLCVAGEGEYCYIIHCNCENVFDNCTLGDTKTRNYGISKFYFSITVNHSSLIFIAFQPANIISVCYNVGELTYTVH